MSYQLVRKSHKKHSACRPISISLNMPRLLSTAAAAALLVSDTIDISRFASIRISRPIFDSWRAYTVLSKILTILFDVVLIDMNLEKL